MSEEIYTMKNLEARFPEEWVAVEVMERDENGVPNIVKLLSHGSNPQQVLDDVKDRKKIGFFYMGEPFPDDAGYVL